jgi:hypothetical protein
MSRHYYDLTQLVKHPLGKQALSRLDLLDEVARHKARFFPRPKAHFELAKPGTLRLIPSPQALERLRADYAEMRTMFFDEPPAFDTLIDRLTQLEAEINSRI